MYDGPYAYRYNLVLDEDNVSYTVRLSEKNNRTIASEYYVRLNGDTVHIRISDSGAIDQFLVNGIDYSSQYSGSQIQVSNAGLFPKFLSRRVSSTQGSSSLLSWRKREKLTLTHNIFHGKTSDSKRVRVVDRIPYMHKAQFAQSFIASFNDSDYARVNAVEFTSINKNGLERIRQLCLLDVLTAYIDAIERQLRSIFEHSAYIGPLRAAGERYYRWQELAIDRIDPKGENFAMYLMTLTAPEMDQFRRLTKEALNYDIKTERSVGNGSILVKEEGTEDWFNIADVGFGFSQILPVLAQLHSITYRRRRLTSTATDRPGIKMLAVEQPELHLHPALQARLADLFAAAIVTEGADQKRLYSGVHIIAETHSEALVNRLSELVENGKIKKEDVAIHIFDKLDNGTPSTIRKAEFAEDGSLKNWPYGFFSYSVGD